MGGLLLVGVKRGGTPFSPAGLMPSRSSAMDIVLAVNCPPHAPAPGQATPSSAWTSSGLDAAGGVRADDLEDVLDGDVAPVEAPGRDRAVVEDEAGDVEARQRHDGGGDGLVAAHQADEAVEQVAARGELDGVGDDLARDQRAAHPLGAHGDPVRHRDRVQLHARAARLADPCLDVHRQLALVEVARHRLDPGRRDADEGAGEVLVREADALEHRPGRRAVGAVGDGGAVSFAGSLGP